MINWYSRNDLFWFRLWGRGVSVRDISKHPLTFSERNGHTKFLKISKWVATYLSGLNTEVTVKTKTYQDARDIQETYKDKPHGWIQWKGTNACIDIHCECGELTHFDGEFMYVIQCPFCNRKYFANGHIQLIEIEDAEGRYIFISSD